MTGAEALQKILDTVDGLTKTVNELKISIHIIEAQIKILNNRAAGLMRETPIATYPSTGKLASIGTLNVGPAVSAGPPQPKQEQPMHATPSRGRAMIETPVEQREEARNFIHEAGDSKGVLTYKKVFGRLVNNDNEPIENVLIKVYDRNNEVCASTETDPIGYWETMLKPGRYVAEYIKTGFKATNKTFDVGKTAKEVEVK